MRKLVFAVSAALALALPVEQAEAWFRAGGGGFGHVGGTWGHYGGVYHGGTAGGFYHGTYVHGGTAYHTGAWGDYYHSPAVVNHYGGCWNCGANGWGYAGAAAAGAVAGAAVGAAATAAAIGRTYGYLPSGCAYSPFNGAPYYSCGGYWVTPAYGANGVYYTVVAAP